MNVEKTKQRGKRMPIYFCGSSHGSRDDQELYRQIIDLLEDYGTVLTKHVGEVSLTADTLEDNTDELIFKREKGLVKDCWAVIAEVSTPSVEVGMELGYADLWSKPTLCLYRPQPGKKLSRMVVGCAAFTVREYTRIEDIPELLHEFLEAATMNVLVATLDRMKVGSDKYSKDLARKDENLDWRDASMQRIESTLAEILKKLN